MQLGRAVRSWTAGVGELGGQTQERGHAPRRHQTANEVAGSLDEGGHRSDQHSDVSVDGHQLADCDLPTGRHSGREPGDRGEEQPGQPACERLDPTGHRANPVTGVSQRPRPRPIAAGVQLLAADPAEHPQPGHDVAGPRCQRRLLLAVVGLDVPQPVQPRPEQPHQHRYADQHDGAEQRGD